MNVMLYASVKFGLEQAGPFGRGQGFLRRRALHDRVGVCTRTRT